MNKDKVNVDAIFILNQNVSLSLIIEICAKQFYKSIVILTTHYLFKNERKQFDNAVDFLQIITFSDLLSDNEMDYCDEKSSQKYSLSTKNGDSRILSNYIHYFIQSSLIYKNKLIQKKIKNLYNYKDLYSAEGLGIEYKVWRSIGALKIKININKNKHYKTIIKKIIYQFHSLVLKKEEINIIENENTKYLFLGSIGRIKLNSEYKTKTLFFYTFPFIIKLFHISTAKQIAKHWICKSIKIEDYILCSTIHSYTYSFSCYNRPIYIVVDGFHPSNYTRSYIDMYHNAIFVTKHVFDEKWFINFNKNVIKPFPFIKINKFKRVQPHSKMEKIVLVLNHAGDWSSLINRSDTDILIEAFVKLAENLSETDFIIRCHPTMTHPSHEGENAINRINEYIKWINLNNLSISTLSLNDDMERGDLFISEYSQVLIDIFQLGKLGIIANFTNRRSFMLDYENIGFLNTNNYTDLSLLITQIINNPISCIEKQNNATDKYNYLLEKWLDTTIHDDQIKVQ